VNFDWNIYEDLSQWHNIFCKHSVKEDLTAVM